MSIRNHVPDSSSYINSPKERSRYIILTQCSFLLYFGTLLLDLFSVIAMLTLHYIIYFFIFKIVFHRPSTCLLVLKEGHKPKPSMSLNICNLYMCIKEIYLFKKVFCLSQFILVQDIPQPENVQSVFKGAFLQYRSDLYLNILV